MRIVSGTETEEEGDACGGSLWGFIRGIILGSSRGYDILKEGIQRHPQIWWTSTAKSTTRQ